MARNDGGGSVQPQQTLWRPRARAHSNPRSAEAGDPAKVQVADLLAQSVSVQSEDLGRLDLIAARPGERRGDQRRLEVVQHPVIKPDLGARGAERVKEIGDGALHRSVKPVSGD